jgi:signal transduction histidine kinase
MRLNKNEYLIKIQDNGSGIQSDAIKNVFEPFFTTKENGSGLGLAISKRLVEQLNGQLKMESVLNQGTTVTIILPDKK